MSNLVFEHVSHAYGNLRAVDDVSLSVDAGELVCLLGPSGCGKTTLLRLAAGLEVLQRGRVLIGDEVMADGQRDVPPEERSVGLVFQDFALFPHLSVQENVAFGVRKASRNERAARARAALKQVAMEDYGEAYPHTLSGGQQQRVALARALAPQPSLMLLDEPFSGLDVQLRQEVRDETLHVLKRSGAATLMVTHDPEEAMFMADRIALMHQGRIQQIGRPEELYYQPVSAFVAAFFGEINRLESSVRDGQVETPLGMLDAQGLGEGAAVDVLIRPEAIKLLPPGEHAGSGQVPGTVVTAKLLGRTSLVHLSVADPRHEIDLHLHVRVPGRFLPPEGQTFSIDLDPHQAFVFESRTRA
ncbi:ABC transporter ATP-binding protein [Aquibaculum sediminis]|uniref:ABC transporter ATP-binding protein n=1 Tax=Aquibaculum sediminis TaxID=3231907 RepID=UPI0034515A8B